MAVSFSAIDLQTRLEVQDLLSRFCHAIDRNMTKEWTELFAEDAYVDAPRFGRFTGRSQIAALPEMVRNNGKGCWRHYLNNVYIVPMEDCRDLRVEAYCTVSDWSQKGSIVRSWDFSAVVGKRRGWKFLRLSLTPITACLDVQPECSMREEQHVVGASA